MEQEEVVESDEIHHGNGEKEEEKSENSSEDEGENEGKKKPVLKGNSY